MGSPITSIINYPWYLSNFGEIIGIFIKKKLAPMDKLIRMGPQGLEPWTT
jgi:hypothetical protein